MRDVYDYVRYFMKNGADSKPDTFDGNMKLQKLLTFANMVSMAEYREPLFDDEILAFKNGCVVEKVRLRYKLDYGSLKRESDSFEPDFSEKEYNILKMVSDIFGSSPARELSEINHEFLSWQKAYKNGTDESGYHDKTKSVVEFTSSDLDKMREIIAAYKESQNDVVAKEEINGIAFYYDNMEMTDEIIDQLEDFSIHAEDNAYSVCLDNDRLVVY